MVLKDTPVIRAGAKDWQTLGAFCDLNAPECQPIAIEFKYDSSYDYVQPTEQTAEEEQEIELIPLEDNENEKAFSEDEKKLIVQLHATEEEKESQREDEEELKKQRVTRHQLLRDIRAELDSLWESQRESIIARVKCEPLDKVYEATRKRNREIFKAIEENAIEYWRRSGLLAHWIGELTWREHDFTFKLRGKTESEKYDSLQNWLDETRLAGLTGCYCFKNGRDYIYIGQAAVLRDRIKQHEKKVYFTYSTAVRIIIPKHKRRLNQLERLLILAHKPGDNSSSGISGKNPVDDCLEFIRGEIKELVTDF
jgi:hypothetical protein